MGRDLRASNQGYPDKCYYYPSNAVNGNKLVPDAKPIGRFYKRDLIPFAWRRITQNNLTIETQYIGTIETHDNVWKIRPGMFVLDQTNMLFVVNEIPQDNDYDSSKEIGTRPLRKTIMVLRGFESNE
jgi:hypothetical protein